MNLKILFFLFGINVFLLAQPVRVSLTVNTDVVNQTNLTPVQTLEKALRDFVNNTKWTNENGTPQSEISIDMLLTITSVNNNSYAGTLQVQSGRLVYGSNYTSPLVNFLDSSFTFTYQEFQPFYFDVNRFNNNLISVFSYYIYLVVGMERDSFSPLGGTTYYERARTIANAAQASNATGWEANQNNSGRFDLIDQLISPAFNDFRMLMYEYHRNGLDIFTLQPEAAKSHIATKLVGLQTLFRRQPNSYVLRAFFDAKGKEIGQLFSDGPEVNIEALSRFLNRFVPSMSGYWQMISR